VSLDQETYGKGTHYNRTILNGVREYGTPAWGIAALYMLWVVIQKLDLLIELHRMVK